MLRSVNRPNRSRSAIAAATISLSLAAGVLSATAPGAASASAADEFRPQLVTVDTFNAADKAALTQLGLDLTEHAGHDYIEAVLHTPADLAKLVGAGFTYDVRIPDLIKRQAEVNAIDEAYAAKVSVSPLPSGRTGYRTLEDYNADMVKLA
uniref:hypothetical protein n=1 Tax=Nocardioides sp. TaxID=35761 RepID=UPI003566BACD